MVFCVQVAYEAPSTFIFKPCSIFSPIFNNIFWTLHCANTNISHYIRIIYRGRSKPSVLVHYCSRHVIVQCVLPRLHSERRGPAQSSRRGTEYTMECMLQRRVREEITRDLCATPCTIIRHNFRNGDSSSSRGIQSDIPTSSHTPKFPAGFCAATPSYDSKSSIEVEITAIENRKA
jgi:hypothetical protein